MEEARVKAQRSPEVTPGTAPTPTRSVLAVKEKRLPDVLRRLHATSGDACVALTASSVDRPLAAPTSTVDTQLNETLGCKTSELVNRLLAQIILLDHPTGSEGLSAEQLDRQLVEATAVLGELKPATATEALLAAQMVGAQRAAMAFLCRALAAGQQVEVVDRNVNRAVRLMRLFTEQVDTMSRLKGTSGQQRVVVEHVTVAAGGQAIVGTVVPGVRGPNNDDRR
jgi:hypothetical protein